MRQCSLIFLVFLMLSCHDKPAQPAKAGNEGFSALLKNYYAKRMELFPLEATQFGVYQYNDLLYANFTDSRRDLIGKFYRQTLDSLHKFDRNGLDENDGISYDILDYYLTLLVKELSYKSNLIPTDQFWGEHLVIGQWGSGEGAQPFKSVEDYDNWLRRLKGFSGWLDSAVVYFRKGIAQQYTLPRPLVRSMIPQFDYMITKDAASNLFYGPVKHLPEAFSEADKIRITRAYTAMIMDTLVPAYKRMSEFLKKEYLPAARPSTYGISALSDGAERYKLLVQLQTTTNNTPEQIRETGYREVVRIKQEMEKIKDSVSFHGTLPQFFEHVKSDPRLTPYKTPEDVLDAFRGIQARITPNLPKYFKAFPKTPFEIRRTEAFRENAASAEYVQSPDQVKPAIFYVPIPDARKFNVTSGMESLFLHEAIPGHHFQISLQIENTRLPDVRRQTPYNNAYVEGWALYCEGMGKELGLYTDPYQYLGALGDEMHRAIRLVVDVSLHTGGMTREQAIKYMMENEAISEQGATAEIERYISGPAQALGYKIGAMKIAQLRDKYRSMLGSRFSIPDFHEEILKDGSMPLTVLEAKMDRWAARVSKDNTLR